MDTLAAIFGAAALYLYLEIWTIRICLGYSAWLVALVLLIDHLLLFVSFSVFPIFLFWKVWFIWTSLRVEPVRGLLWTPQVRLERQPQRDCGLRLLTRRVILVGTLLGLALFSLGLAGEFPPEIMGLMVLALFLGPAVVGLRWAYLRVRCWFAPPYTAQEPPLWEAGPVTH